MGDLSLTRLHAGHGAATFAQNYAAKSGGFHLCYVGSEPLLLSDALRNVTVNWEKVNHLNIPRTHKVLDRLGEEEKNLHIRPNIIFLSECHSSVFHSAERLLFADPL